MTASDSWRVGAAYEAYIGRWSRPVAEAFLGLLGHGPGWRWLDVGCGTGALTSRVVGQDPVAVVGVDPSLGFVGAARASVPAARFAVGDACALPVAANAVDAVVSGLALNFVPDPGRALVEFVRVTVPGGTVGAYVWDYAGRMAMLRTFWDAAVALDPGAAARDEGVRFPLCRPGPLESAWTDAGLTGVTVTSIDVPMVFESFEAFWTPFLGGQGPAPGYVQTLSAERRQALREKLREHLGDSAFTLNGGAWAVQGRVPG
ncbi:class I SAM-dependent methyltransferase [Cryptosporangium aurantiacum]|uniref:Methyltransferase domain-containing protein n=1 Tax=Cryptosporangium aurantiacum TaxID=134849 RepID=A0A1M7RN19_9ACTN|nr:class I SAM-dependent methyltransferase [Cryptosporangium aurantiacum]SHN47725.1 Methyltransferase domain-containing protein [Cryptosporangium aurantiacum]